MTTITDPFRLLIGGEWVPGANSIATLLPTDGRIEQSLTRIGLAPWHA